MNLCSTMKYEDSEVSMLASLHVAFIGFILALYRVKCNLSVARECSQSKSEINYVHILSNRFRQEFNVTSSHRLCIQSLRHTLNPRINVIFLYSVHHQRKDCFITYITGFIIV
jgi:hypothetical protein